MKRLVAVMFSVLVLLVVAGGLYAAGPKFKADGPCPTGSGGFGGNADEETIYCPKKRTNAWERISGAITG